MANGLRPEVESNLQQTRKRMLMERTRRARPVKEPAGGKTPAWREGYMERKFGMDFDPAKSYMEQLRASGFRKPEQDQGPRPLGRPGMERPLGFGGPNPLPEPARPLIEPVSPPIGGLIGGQPGPIVAPAPAPSGIGTVPPALAAMPPGLLSGLIGNPPTAPAGPPNPFLRALGRPNREVI